MTQDPMKRIGIGLIFLLVVGFVGYLAFHAFVYRSCYFSPGIFSWPSWCL
jgi:hypothetical protein